MKVLAPVSSIFLLRPTYFTLQIKNSCRMRSIRYGAFFRGTPAVVGRVSNEFFSIRMYISCARKQGTCRISEPRCTLSEILPCAADERVVRGGSIGGDKPRQLRLKTHLTNAPRPRFSPSSPRTPYAILAQFCAFIPAKFIDRRTSSSKLLLAFKSWADAIKHGALVTIVIAHWSSYASQSCVKARLKRQGRLTLTPSSSLCGMTTEFTLDAAPRSNRHLYHPTGEAKAGDVSSSRFQTLRRRSTSTAIARIASSMSMSQQEAYPKVTPRCNFVPRIRLKSNTKLIYVTSIIPCDTTPRSCRP